MNREKGTKHHSGKAVLLSWFLAAAMIAGLLSALPDRSMFAAQDTGEIEDSMAELSEALGAPSGYGKTEEVAVSGNKDDLTQKNYQQSSDVAEEEYFYKTAEWTDKDAGKANIKLYYQNVVEKPADSRAIYVLTNCTAHGFSKAIAKSNIDTLLQLYDYVDVIVGYCTAVGATRPVTMKSVYGLSTKKGAMDGAAQAQTFLDSLVWRTNVHFGAQWQYTYLDTYFKEGYNPSAVYVSFDGTNSYMSMFPDDPAYPGGMFTGSTATTWGTPVVGYDTLKKLADYQKQGSYFVMTASGANYANIAGTAAYKEYALLFMMMVSPLYVYQDMDGAKEALATALASAKPIPIESIMLDNKLYHYTQTFGSIEGLNYIRSTKVVLEDAVDDKFAMPAASEVLIQTQQADGSLVNDTTKVNGTAAINGQKVQVTMTTFTSNTPMVITIPVTLKKLDEGFYDLNGQEAVFKNTNTENATSKYYSVVTDPAKPEQPTENLIDTATVSSPKLLKEDSDDPTIVKTVDKDTFLQGTETDVTYTITVRNPNTREMQYTGLYDDLSSNLPAFPSGAVIKSVSPDAGATISEDKKKVTWSSVTVPAATDSNTPGTVSMTVVVTFPADSLEGTYKNTAILPAGENVKNQVTGTDPGVIITKEVMVQGYTGQYDAQSHTITVGGVMNSDKVEYSTDQNTWSETKPNFTDVIDTTVYVRVTSQAGNVLDKQATVKITPAPLELTADSAQKVFDGTPLTKNSYQITDGKLLGTDALDVTVSGSITDVGSTPNTISQKTVKNGDRDVTADYTITTKDGTLTISRAEGGLTVKGYEGVYDSQAHTIEVTQKEPGDKISYSVDQTNWSEDLPSFTDVTETTVYVNAENSNYGNRTAQAVVKITPAPLKLSADSAEKVYDGLPLTLDNTRYSITDGSLKGEDKLEVSISGTITNVGSVPSKIDSVKVTKGEKDVSGNYTIETIDGTLKITQASGTLTAGDYTGVYDAKSHTITVQGVIEGDKVSYSTDEKTWTDTLPSYSDVSTTTIYVKAENPNYAQRTAQAVVTITKAPLTLTADSDSKVYDGKPLTLANDRYAITNGELKGEDKLAVTISGSITNVGTAPSKVDTVKVTNGTKDVIGNYNVEKVDGILTITFATGTLVAYDYSGVYDADSHTITVQGMVAGDKLTYSTDEKNWTDTLPTFVNVGKTTVYVKAQNPNYNERSAQAVVTIEKAPLQLTADSETKVYDGKPLTLGNDRYKITDGVLKGKDTLRVTITGTITNVGSTPSKIESYEITGPAKAVTDNYRVTTIDGVLTVTKADGSLKANGYSGQYDGKIHNIEVTQKEQGDKLTYSLDQKIWTSTLPSFIDVCDKVVYVKAENDNYNERTVQATVKITPAPLTLTADSDSKVYDGKPLTLTNTRYSITDGSLKQEDKLTVTVTGSITDVGTVPSKISSMKITNGGREVTEVTGNYDVKLVDGVLTITKATAPLTAKEYTGVYDANSHTITVSGILDGDKVSYSTDQKKWDSVLPSFTNVSETTIYVKAENHNYVDRTTEAVVRITKAPLTLTAHSASKIYDGKPLTLTADRYDITQGQLKGEDTLSLKVAGSITDVGTTPSKLEDVKITNKEQNQLNNYQITLKDGLLEITKATAGLTAKPYKGVYDAVAHTISVSGTIKGDTLSFSLDEKEWSDKLPAYIDVTKTTIYVKAENHNYYDRTANAEVEITRAPLTLTADSATKVYDGTPLKLIDSQYQITAGTILGEDELSAKAAGSITDVGSTFSRIASAVVNNGKRDVTNNYEITLINGILTVTSATATIEAQNYIGVYDAKDHSIAVSGILDGDTITYSVDQKTWSNKLPTFSDVTNTIVYVKAVNHNYKDRQTQAVVQITPEPITLQANSYEKVYDGKELALKADQYQVTSGKIQGDDKLTITVKGSITNVGSTSGVITGAKVAQKDRDVTDNYTFTLKEGTLTVTKATGKVESEGYTGVYDSEDHTIKVDQILEGDKITYSTDGKNWTETKPNFTDVTHTIVYVKVENPNYFDRTTQSVISIEPAPITITADSAEKVYDGKPLELKPDQYQVTEGSVQGSDKLTATATGSITEVGSTISKVTDLVIMDGDRDVSKNYAIIITDGILTVTQAKGTLKVESYVGMYDAEDHGITVSQTLDGDTVYYSTDQKEWSLQAPEFVDVTETTVYVKVVNHNYKDRLSSAVVDIMPAPLTIRADSAEKVYDGKELTKNTYTISAGSVKGKDILTVTIAGVITNVGSKENVVTSAVLHAGTAEKSKNYIIRSWNGVLTVTPASADLKVEGFQGVYDGESHTLKVEGLIEGDKVLYSTDGITWSEKLPSFENVSSNTVYVKVENPNYLDRTAQADIVITPAKLTITADSDRKVYDGKPLTLSENRYTITQGALMKGDELLAIAGGTITNVGTVPSHILSAIVRSGDQIITSNYDITLMDGTLTVVKAVADLTAISSETVYDSEKHSITVKGILEGDVVVYSTDGQNWTSELPYYTDVVNQKIYVQAVNHNYEDRSAEAYVIITPAPITVTAGSAEKIYDGTPLINESYQITQGELKGKDTLQAATKGSITDVGSTSNDMDGVSVTNESGDVTKDYEITLLSGTLTVTSADRDLGAESYIGIYDGASHTIKVTGTKDGDTITYSLDQKNWSENIPEYVDATNTIIYVRAQNHNYKDRTTQAVVKIDPRPLTVTSSSAEKIYDGKELTADQYEITEGELQAEDQLTVTVKGSQTEVGTSENALENVSVQASGREVTGNYIITLRPGLLTVTKRTVTVTAANVTGLSYDGTTHTGTEAVLSGQADGDTLSQVKISGGQRNAGTYEKELIPSEAKIVDQTGKDQTANYNITYVAGTLQINPIMVTITAGNESKVQGDGDPDFRYTITGFVASETPGVTGALDRQSGETPGSYRINQGTLQLTDNGSFVAANYTVQYQPGTLTILAPAVKTGDRALWIWMFYLLLGSGVIVFLAADVKKRRNRAR